MRILVDNERDIHPYLDNLKIVGKGIYQTLGDNSEVVIHDLSNPESSIVFLAGELTDRDLGGPVTDLVLRVLRNEEEIDDVLKYRNQTKNGRTFKSSTMFVKDEVGKVIGCLCINYDITNLLLTQNIIDDLCSVEGNLADDPQQQETFASDVTEILAEMIHKAKSQVDKPVPFMNKEDKLEVIRFLEKRGAFMIKGAVEAAAEDLGVSRYTIYNYLKEIEGTK
ncbi:helix-turn-helix transcriptional regulator [Selenihalanaerobacter shriftii]|uniref:Predicted transcriptional regulator YheO, contains PAS and DNA-binding HTH domains n=1 Tax=Selenihalanaerobacter shriftii TaxID=142842 RepID=A0A1T4R7Q4_9FIRM|nr:helix-turn-helix transcriptional regulator [Selenihalanaerobacter shriftii]SKA11856.1 Predicted transcriptional regulator YheO, contains PAS and DNA-binding HTH domains [Selenihalanaerobacter shriftii]